MGSHHIYKIFRKIKTVNTVKDGQITYIRQSFWCINTKSYELLEL